MVWDLFGKDVFPLAAWKCGKCGSSHSDLFLKIEVPEKKTNTWRIPKKKLFISNAMGFRPEILLKIKSIASTF